MDNENTQTEKDEPRMPNPQEASSKPDVDMRNEVRKGGEATCKK